MFVFTCLPSSPPQLDSLSISVEQLMCNQLRLFISAVDLDGTGSSSTDIYVLPGVLLEILITSDSDTDSVACPCGALLAGNMNI